MSSKYERVSASGQASHETTPQRDLVQNRKLLESATSPEMPFIFEKVVAFEEVEVTDHEALTEADLQNIADWARNLDHNEGRQDLKRRAAERGLLPPSRED